MTLTSTIVSVLSEAFSAQLGSGQAGTIAFCRCLRPEIVQALASHEEFQLKGWRIAAVTDEEDPKSRFITGDRAVEWREAKEEPTLLLVDPIAAGAGVDGIYSASREITERELFEAADECIHRRLPHGYKGFSERALKKARQAGQRRSIAPWTRLTYLCSVKDDAGNAGAELGILGLWPIALGDRPDEADLDKSLRLVERLLPARGPRQSAEARVASLRLPASTDGLQSRLTSFVRESDGLPRAEAMARLESERDFWINRLPVGLFDDQALRRVKLDPWTQSTGRLFSWSGLATGEDGRLEWILSRKEGQGKPLEVRWKTEPNSLPKAAVDYQVEIKSGLDQLAEKRVPHNGRDVQRVVFTADDFDEFDENDRFEAQVIVKALESDGIEDASPDFVLRFGDVSALPKSSAGHVFPSLSLAAASVAQDRETFDHLAKQAKNKEFFGRDAKGYITCRCGGRVSRVFSPPLLTELAQKWSEREGAIGRWRIRVRADGSSVGEPEFIDIAPVSDRFRIASQKFAGWLSQTQGPLGILYENSDLLNDYVLGAQKVWEEDGPELTLVQTLEVQSLAGHLLGLIVLPTHPLRVAWQQGFDLLVAHHRYSEGLESRKLTQLLSGVSGTHCPGFLPGLSPGEVFVFADTLGLHASAMVPIADPEPKATVSLFARLLGGDETVAPTVGKSAAEALAEEVRRYLQLHPYYHRLKVHALRAGDAMPVVRALGEALRTRVEDPEESPDGPEAKLCFELDLYSAGGVPSDVSGRFLAVTAERHRSGAAFVPEEDRWILQSVTRPGRVTLPRLKWSRREVPQPSEPAHLALAFDLFSSRIECRPIPKSASSGVLEAHGLSLMPTRDFLASPHPRWESYFPPAAEGEKHPSARVLTDRQVRLHAAILKATVRHLDGGPDAWPVLVTEVGAEQASLLQDLHQLCDWVITADRNAGIEYFDSPRDLVCVYEAYVIDCVPERDDLGFLQLITSTSCFEEVETLLASTLGEMGLSINPENCRFLLNSLKAISGRLALRLAGVGRTPQEMVAIALTQSQCSQASEGDSVWPTLSDGFFVPLDDVPELFSSPLKSGPLAEQRADLLYVGAPSRGGLRFSLIEVKFRRNLKTARTPDLAQVMEAQIEASCSRWNQLFGERTPTLEKTLNRAWLARVLRFYARKGRRHRLEEAAFTRIMKEIDRFVRGDSQLPEREALQRTGFIFCPEYNGKRPAAIPHRGGSKLWLFGPEILPEARSVSVIGPISTDPVPGLEPSGGVLDPALPAASQSPPPYLTELPNPSDRVTGGVSDSGAPGDAVVVLGTREASDEAVRWRASIRANPHLMILGLPGMGKTTCLINLCCQLEASGITPIVFSYHEDIDEKLANRLRQPPLEVRYAGLGFNPLQVGSEAPLAHLDNAGMLRDIFSAIFPDLGDLQLGRLREALKQSYSDQGWTKDSRGAVPAFRVFVDMLQAEPKPDRGLMMRLAELDDYGLFDNCDGAPSLLDGRQPALIQIHGTQNEHLQRAFATFVLHNLYQSMFRRGTQQTLTHAIIFDEAHRAARLKLIPTMVKECRKYGISFVVASQEAKDFDSSLFNAVANYLALRLNEADARAMAKLFAASDKISHYTDRIKQLPKYRAVYYGEGLRAPVSVLLSPDSSAPAPSEESDEDD